MNWNCGTGSYIQQIRKLNILPLPTYIQSLNFLHFSQLSHEPQNSCELLETLDISSRSNELFNWQRPGQKKSERRKGNGNQYFVNIYVLCFSIKFTFVSVFSCLFSFRVSSVSFIFLD